MQLEEILNNLKKREFVVPEFQREYVWNKTKAKELMVSLYRNFPIGSLLVWETEDAPEIKNKAIDREKLGVWKVLLDGQQRLTALYLIIKNKTPPYYEQDGIEKKYDPRELYFNLKTREFSYYQKSMNSNFFWKKVADCFNPEFGMSFFLDKIDMKNKEDKQLFKTIEDNLRRLKAILTREIPIQTAPPTAGIDEAIDIFDRINSKSTKLTNAELVLTHITGKWPEARRTMKEKIQELSEFFSPIDYKRNLDFLTRCIVVSMTESARYRENAKLKYDEFSEDDYIEHWNEVSRTISFLVQTLKQDALVSNTSELSTTNVLVPIIAHLLKNNCKFVKCKRNDFIYWMFLALIWGRYSGQTEQNLDKDVGFAINSESKYPIKDLEKQISENDRVRIKVEPNDLKGLESGHPIFKMLRIITKHKKPTDWSHGGAIFDTTDPYYTINTHHIFPRSFLSDNGFDLKNPLDKIKVNEIANLAFITRPSNLEIFDNGPSKYLPEVEKKYPGALSQQFIPTDRSLWEIEKYEEFLNERRKLIADAINIFLEELREKT